MTHRNNPLTDWPEQLGRDEYEHPARDNNNEQQTRLAGGAVKHEYRLNGLSNKIKIQQQQPRGGRAATRNNTNKPKTT